MAKQNKYRSVEKPRWSKKDRAGLKKQLNRMFAYASIKIGLGLGALSYVGAVYHETKKLGVAEGLLAVIGAFALGTGVIIYRKAIDWGIEHLDDEERAETDFSDEWIIAKRLEQKLAEPELLEDENGN